jgi:thioredoxin reductase
MSSSHREIVIIGAGPAGIAATIQLHRYNLKPLIFEKHQVGGLLPNANLVENYPGFPGGISGRELTELFSRQFDCCHPEMIYEEVTKVDYGQNQFVISTSKREISADHLIIATGTRPKEFEPLHQPPDSRILYEISTVQHERQKEFVVVGAGDIAFDYALNLSRNNRVTILNRSSVIKALPLLGKRVNDSASIEYLDRAMIDDIAFDESRKVTISYTREGHRHTIDADHAVFALGRLPNFDFLTPELLDMKEKLIKANRLFCVGDVANGALRQTAIAVGQAVHSAMIISGGNKGQKRWN